MTDRVSLRDLPRRFKAARAARRSWEGLWRECYDHTVPRRNRFGMENVPGEQRNTRLFDSTAPDGVERLAASLLAELTPPWSRWFGLSTGDEVPPADRPALQAPLDRSAEVLQGHFDRSDFAVEMHQALLDLVTVGTGCLLVEEAPAGAPSALAISAVPLHQLYLGDVGGRIDTVFRESARTADDLIRRHGAAALPDEVRRAAEETSDKIFTVIEAVWPEPGGGYDYRAWMQSGGGNEDVHALQGGRFDGSPFICFRWMKAPGEVYGRSPVMKVLPDVKTANKVVELILKNASIAVTGIWQAEDDGVINPANIQLKPGAIIPKAVGSAGLTPLSAPGRFDVSELVLADLRERIRAGLLADSLVRADMPGQTATEVLTRSADVMRLLGATYGRLQTELLNPLIQRAHGVLRRRGLVPDLAVDGRLVAIDHRSPLARHQRRMEAGALADWWEQSAALGPGAQAVLDPDRAARWLAGRYGVPADLLLPPMVEDLPFASQES